MNHFDFFHPPTDGEKVRLLAALPHSRGLCGRAKPMDIGLWSDERNQLDMIDEIRAQQAKESRQASRERP